jgi:hypothetical protein
MKLTDKQKQELRDKYNEFIDKETFQVPYDGSNEFYNEADIAAMKKAGDWWLSQIEELESDDCKHEVVLTVYCHGELYKCEKCGKYLERKTYK